MPAFAVCIIMTCHVSVHKVYAARQANRLTGSAEKQGETDTDIHAHKQESADCLAPVSIKFLIRILCSVLPRISAAVMEGESRAYIILLRNEHGAETTEHMHAAPV